MHYQPFSLHVIIQVSFEKRVSPSGETEEGEEEEFKIVKKTLFQRSNAYPQKKVLTFNRYSKDFPFSVYYSHLGFLSEEEKSYVRVDVCIPPLVPNVGHQTIT